MTLAQLEREMRGSKLARALRAALAGVADWTGRSKSIGWCWCGGSIDHDRACRRAQKALAAADLFLKR